MCRSLVGSNTVFFGEEIESGFEQLVVCAQFTNLRKMLKKWREKRKENSGAKPSEEVVIGLTITITVFTKILLLVLIDSQPVRPG